MAMSGSASVIAAVAVMLFMVVCFAAFIGSRYRKAGPNEALIIYGADRERVVVGGGSIVWPVVNKVRRLSLEPKSVDVAIEDIETQSGAAVKVAGLAQIKVERSDAMIRRAAGHVLDKPEEEIREVARQSIESHLRSELRSMTPEAAQQEQEQLAQRVTEAASEDMASMGLCVENLIIRDIRES